MRKYWFIWCTVVGAALVIIGQVIDAGRTYSQADLDAAKEEGFQAAVEAYYRNQIELSDAKLHHRVRPYWV
jgi:hypothetical protein